MVEFETLIKVNENPYSQKVFFYKYAVPIMCLDCLFLCPKQESCIPRMNQTLSMQSVCCHFCSS